MSIKLDPNELPAELVRRFGRLPGMAKRASIMTANRGMRLLTKNTPVDLGQMKNSWRVVVTGGKTAKGTVQIVNDAPHAGIIEEGARPHKVSPEGREALKEWAMRVIGVKEDEAGRVAEGIARKLAKEGQKGHFITKDALPELRQMLAKEIAKRIKRQAKRRAKGATNLTD